MASANKHMPSLDDDGRCQVGQFATKLINEHDHNDKQKSQSRSVANLLRSTTSCILDNFKRRVSVCGNQQYNKQANDVNEQQHQHVDVRLAKLFSQISEPITIGDHANKSMANKCRWSFHSNSSNSNIKTRQNSKCRNIINNKSPLAHTLSAPGLHVMQHNGCDSVTINNSQHDYHRQYNRNTVADATANSSCSSSNRLSRKLSHLMQCNTLPLMSGNNEAATAATVMDNGRHRARVLQSSNQVLQASHSMDEHNVKLVVPSSKDIVNNQGNNSRGASALMLDLSLTFNKQQSQLDRATRNLKLDTKTVDKTDHDGDGAGDGDVDGGYAWIVLIVIFVINASTFGTARAYGLIFDKLAREDDKSRTEAAMPFTIMGAVENMAGPLSGYLLAKTNNSWRATVFSGSCLIALAHLLAALLADSQIGQLLSLGLMCGLGLSLVTISFFQLNNAYFVRYRSTAFGLGMTGAVFGTLYISPLCQYFLDNYGTSMCYLMLSLILLPNVPLSLLLKPKGEAIAGAATTTTTTFNQGQGSSSNSSSSSALKGVGSDFGDDSVNQSSKTISAQLDTIEKKKSKQNQVGDASIWFSVKRVVCNPMFHLIWPTQLLFCWLNFVFGMIIVDFGRDRGLNTKDVSYLVPCWAFGQLVGRLFLSSLIDLKFLAYKSFTVICFFSISATTLSLNYISLPTNDYDYQQQHPIAFLLPTSHMHTIFLLLVFVLSAFVALLFILFNGLVINYVETSLQPLSIGISSFTGSFFLLPRANIIGYYRDTTGNYDTMFTMFTYITLCAALIWLIIPGLCSYLKGFTLKWAIKRQESHSRIMDNMRVYSESKLTSGSGSIKSKDNRFDVQHRLSSS